LCEKKEKGHKKTVQDGEIITEGGSYKIRGHGTRTDKVGEPIREHPTIEEWGKRRKGKEIKE